MAAEIVLTPEATEDADAAYAWYEGQRIGLGEDFLVCLEACFERISRNPELSPMVREPYRRALVRRFPYAVYFKSADGRVTVYAIFHTARDPKKWRRRLS